MKNKYLPIGTVCDIKTTNKKAMIIGYCMPEFNGDLKIKDYIGCVYPEGLLHSSRMFSFNHDDIININFLGFKNDEYERLDALLNKNNDNDVEKAKTFHEDNEMYLTSNNTYSKLLFDENGVVMLAEKNPMPRIEFDENGYVISVGKEESVENPFHKEYNQFQTENIDQNYDEWNIFNKLEFDENGVVIENNTNLLNKIEFDEGGTEKLDQENKYNFDVNDNLNSENSYTFDENGILISVKNEKTEDVLQSSNYRFDAEGNVISQETYEFDNQGNLLSIDTFPKKEISFPAESGITNKFESQNLEFANYDFDDYEKIESN